MIDIIVKRKKQERTAPKSPSPTVSSSIQRLLGPDHATAVKGMRLEVAHLLAHVGGVDMNGLLRPAKLHGQEADNALGVVLDGSSRVEADLVEFWVIGPLRDGDLRACGMLE